MSRVLKILLALLLAVGIAAAAVVWQFNQFLGTPVEVGSEGSYLEISPGTAFSQVSNELAERGIISNPTFFRIYGRLSGNAGKIHAGEYLIANGSTPKGLLDQFVSGNVQLYSFTIVEGWTFRELLAALAADPIVENTMEYEDWRALLESLAAEATHPEGLFLPETYRFPKGTRDVDLLRQAYELMQEVLAEEWAKRAVNLPLATPLRSPGAGLDRIEKETALASERPRIAGVFVRRLQKGMRLQTDPTVIYGIGVDFNGNLTRT